jgi:hypothetical protein
MLLQTRGGRLDASWEQQAERDHQPSLSAANEHENANSRQDIRHGTSAPPPECCVP